MKNILVPIEFTEQTDLLLKKASEIAQKFESKIWLLHIAAPDPYFVGYEVGPQYIRDSRADELRTEHRTLQSYTQQLTKQGITCESLLIEGVTTEMILEESKKLKIDLIVIGHNKHSFLYKLLFSTTDIDVINHSNVPVLVVPTN